MRFLLLLASVAASAADTSKLRIYELAEKGQPAALADLPRLREAQKDKVFTQEMPNPVFRLSDLTFLAPSRKEKLDLYLPHGPARSDRPAVVFIHGGGFTGGDKAEYRSASVSADLARAGYVVVSCNYVLGPKTKEGVWPQNIADCREAVRWVRGHAKELGVNPDRIAVAGGSAGGYLALMVGLSEDKTGPGGDPKATVSAKVAAVIDLYGVVNFSKHGKGDVPGASAAEQAAYLPENQCDRADPPVLILHGTADTTVDIRQSMDMAAALAKAKVAHELIVVEGAPHTFDLHPKGTGWTRVTVRWAANGDQTRVETRSAQPDLAEPTLDFLGRTIGK
ncbi:carboxylesterase NlhH [Opitutia bacterium]|nr:carboxylesterase NlhH [Opitutae bacterium]